MREEMLGEHAVEINRRRSSTPAFSTDGVQPKQRTSTRLRGKRSLIRSCRGGRKPHGLAFQPFDIEADYLNYVDGRPRDDGIRSFLGAQGISLPEGSEHEPEDADTVHSLGERKTRLFLQALQKGVDPAAGAEALLKKLRKAGIRTAVGSSSKNTAAILHAAALENHFDVCIDGLDAEAVRLPGKPDPALFLEIARRLNVQPSRAILFEDALTGVEAGKRGGFGCVVGIDHGQQREALRQRGAPMSSSKACERCT